MSSKPQGDAIVSSSEDVGSSEAVAAEDRRPVWIPLESDPDIMSDYLRMLSLTEHYLIDVPVIDEAEELGIFVGHNVKAFIFLYEINSRTESETAEAADAPDAPADLYHMQQLCKNSCGSVALFHAYLNTVDHNLFEPDSIMFKHYWSTVDQSFEKRGETFADNEQINAMHHQHIHGQTNAPSGQELNNINYHFVAIVYKSGAVYKMDGRCVKPVKMGECSEDAFKAAGLNAIKSMIARDPDNFNFSILAFCGN